MKLQDAIDILSKEDSIIPIELQTVLNEMKGSRKSAAIFLAKYCATDGDELLEMTKSEVWHRISDSITQDPELQKTFFSMFMNNEVVPGGRITASVGIPGRLTAFNCYVGKAPGDTIDSIFDSVRDMAKTFSYGGGYGFALNNLRPKGTPVDNAARTSSGPASFMDIFSKTTGTIGQHNRRGALMMTLSVEHPDIYDFINIKQFDRESIDDTIIKYVRGESSFENLKDAMTPTYSVNHANISVQLTDKFMKAVEKDTDFELKWTGKLNDETTTVSKTIKARDLWNNIIKNAWSTAEPGLLFWDTMVREHNGEYFNPLSSTNPCSEQPLPENSDCLLAHINTSILVEDPFTNKAKFNIDKFKELINSTVSFLDLVIDANIGRQALKAQDEMAIKERRIGLGITGLADMFFKLNTAYGSNKSKKILKEIMFTLAHTAYRASIGLAKEVGQFPAFEYDKFIQSGYMQRLLSEIDESGIDPDFKKDLKKYGTRNVTLLTIAPVGTGSEILGGVSSGVEPIFATQFTRVVRFQDGKKEFTEYAPVVKEYMTTTGVTVLPEYLVTAHDLNPDQRIEIQSIMQKYIDSAISSTINLPNEATVEEVARIYMQAWKAGLKGVTIYREGCREGVLRTGKLESRSLLKKLFKNSRDMIAPRPVELPSVTYAVKYCPTHKARISICMSPESLAPVEINIVTKDPAGEASAKELSILVTALLRRDAAHAVPSDWIIDELEEIISLPGAFHMDDSTGKSVYISGLAQATSYALKKFMDTYCNNGHSLKMQLDKNSINTSANINEHVVTGEICPKCKTNTYFNNGGCFSCSSCGYSRCS
jgi:ribonucleoside-diphosphate reductase alpha chain